MHQGQKLGRKGPTLMMSFLGPRIRKQIDRVVDRFRFDPVQPVGERVPFGMSIAKSLTAGDVINVIGQNSPNLDTEDVALREHQGVLEQKCPASAA